MKKSQNNQQQYSKDIPTINASKLVSYFIVFLGLFAEYFVIWSILGRNINTSNQYEFSLFIITMIAVVFMLLHQFLIFRNFNILDHIPHDEYKKNYIGDWIGKSRWEDFLRILIFLSFAFLTGEVIYLLIVSRKLIGLINVINFNNKPYYDIDWITNVYLVGALIMTCLMLLWDIIAIKYDKISVSIKDFLPDPNSITNFDKYKDNAIVSYPLDKPYFVFLVSDSFGVVFWACLVIITINKSPKVMLAMTILTAIYAIVIITRLIGEFKINKPRLKVIWKNYKENTKP
jgi:hypothetical protein